MNDIPSSADDAEQTGFADLGLRPELLAALTELGYEEPTPIQRAAIAPVREGRDVLGQAATGTGKTAAFALPILERIVTGAAVEPLALVLVPTRELAMQVSQAVHRYGRALDAQVVPVYGGQPIGHQIKVLRRGVHVVVATPGRAIDHLQRGTLAVEGIELVVLDEADEMLDMGFAEDIEAILAALPETRQTVLFSATLPPRISAIVDRHLHDPARLELGRATMDAGDGPLVEQRAYLVARHHKAAALGRILDTEDPTAALVFCRTRGEVDELTETLNGRGYRAEALHGGMDQDQRERVLGRLRSGTAELLVATDVAARGLDVDHLTHVVNYDVPSAPEAYVHRIGRVGRAGRTGVAITLVEPRQRRMLANLERAAGRPVAITPIPTVADLRARQMELTLEQVREALGAEDLDRFRAVVDALSSDHDPVDIALAAVKLAHEASGATDDATEIPDAPDPGSRPKRDKGRGRDDRRPGPKGGKGDKGDRRPPSGDAARLWVGSGRSDGMRPKDLVGAIAGETRLRGDDIGAIRIFDRFSLVDVPEAAAGQVIAALKGTTLRGKKVPVRRDRGEQR